jgi:hypothetical protein
MKNEFNVVATNIPIASGWSVDKVHYEDGNPQVTLVCGHARQGTISVGMNLDKGEFTSSFPQPFTRNPPAELAKKVRAAINAPKP